jgi:hypothetical protein
MGHVCKQHWWYIRERNHICKACQHASSWPCLCHEEWWGPPTTLITWIIPLCTQHFDELMLILGCLCRTLRLLLLGKRFRGCMSWQLQYSMKWKLQGDCPHSQCIPQQFKTRNNVRVKIWVNSQLHKTVCKRSSCKGITFYFSSWNNWTVYSNAKEQTVR